jgi:hypothetical protein
MKRGNSFVSQVESINEVDKLYTKEEMKITKIVGRIKETHSQMKMSWVHNEVDESMESSIMDKQAGSAMIKKNPGRFGSTNMSRMRSSGRNSGMKNMDFDNTVMEKEAKKYIKDKE